MIESTEIALSFWNFLIPAIATIGSAVITSSSNSKAAKTVANAENESARIQNEAIDKQITAMREGVAEGREIYERIQNETAPGVSYLRDVMASGTDLTPEQVSERDRLRRVAANSANVAGSALRGSGRSFVDAMRAVEGDFTNRALALNRDRADRAASTFSTPYFNAAGNSAAAASSLGRDVGGAIAQQGLNTGSALTAGAEELAASRLANTRAITGAAGDIGAIILEQQKQSKYDSQPTGSGGMGVGYGKLY